MQEIGPTWTTDENELRSIVNTQLCICTCKEGKRGRREARVGILDTKMLEPHHYAIELHSGSLMPVSLARVEMHPCASLLSLFSDSASEKPLACGRGLFISY